MWNTRMYVTWLAIVWGIFFWYILSQIQHNPDFLLGDIFRLALPEHFVGVYYEVHDEMLEVWQIWLSTDTSLDIVVGYNPDRVSLNMDALQSTHVIVDSTVSPWSVQFTFVLGEDEQLFMLPFVSDEEYHILVSSAVLAWEFIAIQRIGYDYSRID